MKPLLAAVLAALAGLTPIFPARAQRPAPPPPAPAPGGRGLGQPLAGLGSDQLAAFQTGRAQFAVAETPATGLGPIFNNVSCVACHAAPASGGASAVTVTRFGRSVDGVFDPLASLDGTLLHARAIAPALQETVPEQANVVAKRLTTPLYGAGLIEAIPDASIVANAARSRTGAVSGKVAWVTDPATGEARVGRFGWKAQHATLLAFAGDAYNNEMGITNRLFPAPAAPDGNTQLLARFISLGAPPEDQPGADGRADIDRFADYMRYLAAPAPAPASPQSAAGAPVFASAGCAACHTPSFTTGPGAVAALSQRTVALYSDLLLHDMGALGDGIAQAAAGTREMRTAPLWGLAARRLYLHDGRATTVDAAIRAHDGEAAAARDAYVQLAPAAQQQLLAFLQTL
ncbi:MAG TPA: di-heme oxidoredictase family protein [Opitutaceae bacterium]|nr:di-heme oxidoredictase family protein [Opitutaceae bacterium]